MPFSSNIMRDTSRIAMERPLTQLTQIHPIADKQLVFINPPMQLTVQFVPFLCTKLGIEMPKGSWSLGSGLITPFKLFRVDEKTLELEAEEGFLGLNLDSLYRGLQHPMHVGQKVTTNMFDVQVLTLTPDKRPLRVRFTFPIPLNDASLMLLTWEKGRFVPYELPKIGTSDILAVAALPYS